jgi:DNA-binding NarL/FixJ family response regulator
MTKDLRIALVEDQPEYRRRLAGLLREQPGWTLVLELNHLEGTGPDLVAAKPDLVLLDVLLPGRSAVDALPEIRAAVPAAKIVILSVVHDTDRIVAGLELGACSYLTKDCRPAEIL